MKTNKSILFALAVAVLALQPMTADAVNWNVFSWFAAKPSMKTYLLSKITRKNAAIAGTAVAAVGYVGYWGYQKLKRYSAELEQKCVVNAIEGVKYTIDQFREGKFEHHRPAKLIPYIIEGFFSTDIITRFLVGYKPEKHNALVFLRDTGSGFLLEGYAKAQLGTDHTCCAYICSETKFYVSLPKHVLYVIHDIKTKLSHLVLFGVEYADRDKMIEEYLAHVNKDFLFADKNSTWHHAILQHNNNEILRCAEDLKKQYCAQIAKKTYAVVKAWYQEAGLL